MYSIGDHYDREYLIPVARVTSDASEIANMFANETSFLDEANTCVYIPDIGDDTLYGVMIAELDLVAMDADDDPVEWALGNVPAPGTGADNRMELVETDQAADEIAERVHDFFIVR